MHGGPRSSAWRTQRGRWLAFPFLLWFAACSSSNGGQAMDPCGDPIVAQRFAACRQAQDQPSCEAAGGTFTRIGLSPDPQCQCPTGQENCPCTDPTSCLSVCIAPP